MKIIHCLNYFLPQQVAGTEMYAFSLAKELIKKNIECLVIIPNYSNATTEDYFYEGIRVIQFAETSKMDRALIMGKRKPDGLLTFIEILKLEKPSLIHFHELEWGSGITLHHLLTAKKEGFKTVMTFHLASYSCKTGSLVYKDKEKCDGEIKIRKCTECYFSQQKLTSLQNYLLRSASLLSYKIGYDVTKLNSKIATALGFPFVIQKMKEDLKNLEANCDQLIVYARWYARVLALNGVPENKITYIEPGLTAKLPGNLKSNKTGKTIKLVFIGRISPFKGIHLLIDAFKKVNSNRVTLDIFGKENDDDYVNKCKKTTKEISGIQWKGSLEPAMVINTLIKYDVLCLPSTFSEMSPLVIQEAFGAGIPVIASNVYGNAEQIKEGINGWLFRFKDSTDLAIKLQSLIDDPGIVDNAKRHLPPITSFQEIANKYLILYSKII